MQPSSNQARSNLALLLQEVLTATVRLRANAAAVQDAASFRTHIVGTLRSVEQEGRQMGYTANDLRLAAFAVVAFLDESILNSQNPTFAGWPRKPLQEELFGGHLAGETFFTNIANLLRAEDSRTVADVLEVYQLCLVLGYQGRYTIGNRGELEATKRNIAEKLVRIKGRQELAPDWEPRPGTVPKPSSDALLRPLTATAIACAVLAIVLFVAFSLSLQSGASAIRNLANGAKVVAR